MLTLRDMKSLKMKYLSIGLILLSSLVFIQTSRRHREVANQTSCSLNALFKEVQNNENDLRTFSQLLDESVQQYKAAEYYKNEYDQLIDNQTPFNELMTSSTYSKLLVLRESREHLKHKFLTIIKKEIEEKISTDLLSDETNVILDALLEKRTILKNKVKSNSLNSFTTELAFANLHDELDEKISLIRDCLKKQSLFDLLPTINDERKEIMKQKMSIRKEWIQKAKETESLGQFTTYNISEEKNSSKTFIQSWKEKQSEFKNILGLNRGPSEKKIYPSAGKEGNMFGLDFPENTYALTFDDGPAKTTIEVIDNLHVHNIKATFFVLSQQIVDGKYPKTALLEQKEGHAIGSHSFTHANFPKISSAKQDYEILDAAKVFESRFGVKPQFFRLPYGAGVSISSIRQKIADAGMIHVFWTVDTLDWQDLNPDSIMQRALKQMNEYKRGIILFHDVHPQSVIASEKLMTYFNDPENKLRLVTIPEIVDELNR